MAVNAGDAGAAAVGVGDAAPDFELRDQHGTPVRLSGFRGRKKVVLVFYPLAFSGVCTGELTRLRDEFRDVAGDEGDVRLLAVSVDSMFALRAWSDQEKFWFPLLSDFWPHGGTAQRYGVFDEAKGLALRGTFVIDTEGVVRWKVVNALPDARDIDEYRKALAGL
ncbi:peroxiredoxin [Actinomadura sp.]|uniref:peroxiredoxin n=1 Tax=Actinomadura sp. TaxID=1989 RepID=UPI00335ADAA5